MIDITLKELFVLTSHSTSDNEPDGVHLENTPVSHIP